MVWGAKWQGLYYRNAKIFQFNQNSSSLFVSNGANLLEYSVSAGALIATHSFESEITGFYQKTGDQALISSVDGELVLWNLKEAKKIQSWKLWKSICSLVVNPSDANILYLSVLTNSDQYCIVKYGIDSCSSKEIQSSKSGFDKLFSDFSGKYVIGSKGKTLYVFDVEHSKLQRYQHNNNILSISVHPIHSIVATGDSIGHIYYWSLDTNNSEDVISDFRNVCHWHAHGVYSLSFTKDGGYLLSGGEEGVLVIWNSESFSSTFLPRLGSTIVKLDVSLNSKYYAILLEENTILLVNASTLQIDHRIQKLRSASQDNNSHISIDPTSNLATLNASSYLQFYNYIQDEYVNELEVSGYLKVRGPNSLSESILSHYTFSADGKWLLTVDKFNTSGSGSRSIMRFWKSKNTKKNGWYMNTKVEEGHKDEIISIISHPIIPLFVSISKDKSIKVWSILDMKDPSQDKDTSSYVVHWICRSIGTYKSLSPSVASISKDGSILAVAYNNIVTLWNLNTMVLLKEFPIIGSHSYITHLDFISKSPYLAITTNERLYLYNLLNYSLHWSFVANINLLHADPNSNKLLVTVTSNNLDYLLLFTTDSCKPQCYWKFNEQILSVTFIGDKSLQSLNSAANSGILILVNSSTKPLLLLEEYEVNIPVLNTSSSVVASSELVNDAVPTRGVTSESAAEELNKHNKIELESGSINKSIYHLFDAPTHILPPIPSIYKSFMEILLAKSNTNNTIITPKDQTRLTNGNSHNLASAMEIEKEEYFGYKGASENDQASISQFFSSMQIKPQDTTTPTNDKPKNSTTPKKATPKKATPVKSNKKQ